MSGMGIMGPAWRSLRSDRSVVNETIDRRTVRRVLGFARPHRRLIAGFLALTVIDSCLVVVTPLLIQRIVDDGILKGNHTLVTVLALGMVAVALVGALLAIGSGYLSSRIGEGLIFDLRTVVFGHVQRQSLAFFTRTQTGALVSRLNNDVIGAQRAFTSTLSSAVSSTVSVFVVGIAMFALSWQVTLLCLALFPLLLLISRLVSARLAGLTRQQMDGNADMGNAMTERFNVGGAMLLKLFGRRGEEDAMFADKAATVRDLGVRISLITRIFSASMLLIPALATALVYGVGGHLAIEGTLTVGTLLALGTLLLRLLGPAAGALQRPHRRDDRPGQLRAGLRGARPALDDPRAARRGGAAPVGGPARVRPRRLHLPACRRDLAGLPRVGRARRVPRLRPGPGRHLASSPSAARWWPWSGRRAPARRRSPTWSPGSTTPARERCASAATTYAT